MSVTTRINWSMLQNKRGVKYKVCFNFTNLIIYLVGYKYFSCKTIYGNMIWFKIRNGIALAYSKNVCLLYAVTVNNAIRFHMS